MSEESVKVAVRCRPFNEREKSQNESNIININTPKKSVSIINPKTDAKEEFVFDFSYGETCVQKDVYETIAKPLVEAALKGFNATIFAYGQTGTGKSFSMEGVRSVPELRGIIPNCFNHIFDAMASSKDQVLVRCSYLEIYNEEVRDLLSTTPTQKLDLKENPEIGVYVKDLKQFVVTSPIEMDQLMDKGQQYRSVAATKMNAHSSRSHSIFTIVVETCDKEHGLVKAGKLNLVDLAGSERQSKTGAEGDTLKEATKINLSLSALGNVISALVSGSSHIPYRDSKLTRLLQDSLGGNAKTLMIATLSPAAYNFDETLSTLRYAARTKNIKNKPVVNEDPKDALLRQYQDEIKKLRIELAFLKAGAGAKVAPAIEDAVMVEKIPSEHSVHQIEKASSQHSVHQIEKVSSQHSVHQIEKQPSKHSIHPIEKEPSPPFVQTEPSGINPALQNNTDITPSSLEQRNNLTIFNDPIEPSPITTPSETTNLIVLAPAATTNPLIRRHLVSAIEKQIKEINFLNYLKKAHNVHVVDEEKQLDPYFENIKNLPRSHVQKHDPNDIDLERQHIKKVKNKYRRICLFFLSILILILGAIIIAIIAGVDPFAFNPTKLNVNVMQLSSSNNTAASNNSYFAISNALASSSSMSYAMIDDIRLQISAIGIASSKDGNAPNYLDSAKDFSLGATVEPSIINTIITTWFVKSFDGFSLDYNSASIKAFCRTKNYLMYTTSTGLKKINPNSTSIPSDYDYYSFGPAPYSRSSQFGFSQFDPFSVNSGMTNIGMYVDNSFSIFCYDGIGDNVWTTPNVPAMFTIGKMNLVPNFDIALKLLPISFVVTTNASAISDPLNIDFWQTQIVTLTTEQLDNGNNQIIAASATNPWKQLPQVLMGPANFLLNGNYSFTDGGQKGNQNVNLEDRKMINFYIPLTTQVVVQSMMSDGPDCGNEYGRQCIGSGVYVNFYWRMLVRG